MAEINKKNYVCIEGKKHYFVPNHPKQDLCKSKCSLLDICFNNCACETQLCKIYDKDGNGHYELEEQENEHI